jgi:hypothetical protein
VVRSTSPSKAGAIGTNRHTTDIANGHGSSAGVACTGRQNRALSVVTPIDTTSVFVRARVHIICRPYRQPEPLISILDIYLYHESLADKTHLFLNQRLREKYMADAYVRNMK